MVSRSTVCWAVTAPVDALVLSPHCILSFLRISSRKVAVANQNRANSDTPEATEIRRANRVRGFSRVRGTPHQEL